MTVLSDLLQKVREGLDEPVPIVWSDTELLHYLQSGVALLWKLAVKTNPDMVARCDVVTVLKDEGSVKLPYEPLKLLFAKREMDNRELTFVSFSSLPVSGQGVPLYCSLTGRDMLRFSPVASEDTGLIVYGVPQPPVLALEDESPFPYVADELLVDWALVKAYNRDEAIPQMEMQYVQQHKADLDMLFELRDPQILTGQGPWVV